MSASEVTVGNQTKEAVDPYARAAGVNGNRAMVVDLELTDPEHWAEGFNPEFSGNQQMLLFMSSYT